MPIPAPYVYVQLDSIGDEALADTNVGVGASISTNIMHDDYLSWNDTSKSFMVSAGGAYKLEAALHLSAATTLCEIKVKQNDIAKYVVETRVNGAVDPVERSILKVLDLDDGDDVGVTISSNSGVEVRCLSGTTMFLSRIK